MQVTSIARVTDPGSGIMKYVNCTEAKRACLELARIRQLIVEDVSELEEKDQPSYRLTSPKKTMDFTLYPNCPK